MLYIECAWDGKNKALEINNEECKKIISVLKDNDNVTIIPSANKSDRYDIYLEDGKYIVKKQGILAKFHQQTFAEAIENKLNDNKEKTVDLFKGVVKYQGYMDAFKNIADAIVIKNDSNDQFAKIKEMDDLCKSFANQSNQALFLRDLEEIKLKVEIAKIVTFIEKTQDTLTNNFLYNGNNISFRLGAMLSYSSGHFLKNMLVKVKDNALRELNLMKNKCLGEKSSEEIIHKINEASIAASATIEKKFKRVTASLESFMNSNQDNLGTHQLPPLSEWPQSQAGNMRMLFDALRTTAELLEKKPYILNLPINAPKFSTKMKKFEKLNELYKYMMDIDIAKYPASGIKKELAEQIKDCQIFFEKNYFISSGPRTQVLKSLYLGIEAFQYPPIAGRRAVAKSSV
ncbi:hypothetical protein DFP86_103170 [Paludibacterium purpuratum]|uniref:Uncharacterized protein n=2 Tax=Paludibacterium purpuratum TaxID=1144873 RepID=A0A4R7BD11_9NEIS|nr:hypothetical protein DFP86_103170 [Paludibacterium purpuratum]